VVIAALAGLALFTGSIAHPRSSGQPRGSAPTAGAITLTAAGLSLPYPAGWQATRSPDGTSVTLTPPGSDPSYGSPSMSVTYVAGAEYAPAWLPPQSSAPVAIMVSGARGWEVDGRGVLPPQNHYVLVPWGAGMLFGVAYADPATSLGGDLDTMLRGSRLTGVTP
jgi:hypothetical protein